MEGHNELKSKNHKAKIRITWISGGGTSGIGKTQLIRMYSTYSHDKEIKVLF